jgi:hypothetical protein
MLLLPVRQADQNELRGVIAFDVGCVLGALTTALLAFIASGLASPVPTTWAAAGVATFAVAAVLRDLHVVHFWLPQNARQVPRDVVAVGRNWGLFRFGYELGTGVRTYVPSTAPFVVLVAVVLLGNGTVAALIAGLGFGLGRALMPLSRYFADLRESWDAKLTVLLGWMVPTSTAACALGVLAILTTTGG